MGTSGPNCIKLNPTLPSAKSVMPLKPQAVDSIRVERIQSRCNQILEDLYGRDLVIDPREAEIEALKQEYNQLSRDQESLFTGPPMDPLERLPPEVWTDVILEATNENGANLLSTDALLLLTLVNNNWSRGIMQSPRLWTKITIGRGEADAQAKLKTALHLSAHLRFQLTVNILPCEWLNDLSLLQPHTSRIKDIVLRYSQRRNYQDGTVEEFLGQFFLSLGHFPSLQIIQCRVRSPLKWTDIFTRSPNMAYIHGQEVPFETIRSHMRVPLRACIINTQSSGIMKHIDEFTNLEEVTWRLKKDVGNRWEDVSFTSLPSLKRIHSYGTANADLSNLLRLAGNLTTLELLIQKKWQHLYMLFNLFEHLPHLQGLDLTLGGLLGNLSFPEIRPTKTLVQGLKITIIHHEVEQSQTESIRNEEALFTVFPIHFSEVKSLSLECVHFGLHVSKYINSLSRLWSLYLSEIPTGLDKNASIESHSLQKLHLKDIEETVSSELVSTIKCPSLSRLELDQVQCSFPKLSHPCQNPLLIIKNSVESLLIKSSQDLCIISTFDALRRLRVGARDDDSESDFLTSFIVDPELCPSLRELEISFIPEWDLLFLALERRNYLPPSRRVAPIETLILPSPIAPTLITPLTEILRGRFTKRPSNLDLSFCGFMEAYFDPNISGCRRCIRSMMSCTTAPRPYDRDPLLYGDMTLPSYSAKVPIEVWEWLEQRENRLLDWVESYDTWQEGGLVRYAVCTTMQMAQRPFIITGHRGDFDIDTVASH